MTDLHTSIRQCTNCHLHSAFSGPVPGFIGKQYGLLIIGEAPGHEEDQAVMPFVGKSGRYLRHILRQAHIPGDYISFANMVSCRPTLKREKNRPPRQDELSACRTNLLAQVAAANPRVVLTVGAIASRFIYQNIELKHDHGRPILLAKNRIQVPAYHPAFVLKKKSEQEPTFLKDIKAVSNLLYSGVNSNWPTTCRICGNDIDKYAVNMLAYCNQHYAESQKTFIQSGLPW